MQRPNYHGNAFHYVATPLHPSTLHLNPVPYTSSGLHLDPVPYQRLLTPQTLYLHLVWTTLNPPCISSGRSTLPVPYILPSTL